MSSVSIQGNASGTGIFTIASPNSNTNRTLTLPDATGTLNTSGAVNEVPAGSASAPAIYPTGDSNTGIFFPAADTIAFAEGGAEAMRIDSSGNVGIGTTAPSSALEVYLADTTYVRARENLTNKTVGYQIVANGGTPTAVFSSNTATGEVRLGGIATNYFQTFYTSNSERMRITSGGEVYIAGTTDQGAYNLQCNGTGVWGAGAYVNGSDARIKEDVAPIDSGLDVVEKLNPVTYRYKEDWSKDQSVQTGFIAQELLVALDGKNYVDGIVQQGGSESYYSVAYQNIIPILTKAIQELNVKVEAQAAEIAALKGQA